MLCNVRLTKLNQATIEFLANFSLAYIIENNKFISRNTLRKHKARENKTPS